MKLVGWKNYLGGQILYRVLVPPIKNGVNENSYSVTSGIASVVGPRICWNNEPIMSSKVKNDKKLENNIRFFDSRFPKNLGPLFRISDFFYKRFHIADRKYYFT